MPVTDYYCSVDDVAEIDLIRTTDAVGNLVGTFTDATRPTDQQVQMLIERAAVEVGMYLGEDVVGKLQDEVKSLVSLRAAMYVELTFYATEIHNDLSSYPYYKILWDEAIAKLTAEVEEAEGEVPGFIDEGYPQYSFPYAEPLWGKKM